MATPAEAAVALFLESTREMGTLDVILEEAGYAVPPAAKYSVATVSPANLMADSGTNLFSQMALCCFVSVVITEHTQRRAYSGPFVIPMWREVSLDVITRNLHSAGMTRERYFELLASV